MKLLRIKAVDHYSDNEHLLDITYIYIYGSEIESNPFYLRVSAFWVFITKYDGTVKLHPIGWECPILNVLHSNIVQLATIEI